MLFLDLLGNCHHDDNHDDDNHVDDDHNYFLQATGNYDDDDIVSGPVGPRNVQTIFSVIWKRMN